jgi:hypothetical protein
MVKSSENGHDECTARTYASSGSQFDNRPSSFLCSNHHSQNTAPSAIAELLMTGVVKLRQMLLTFDTEMPGITHRTVAFALHKVSSPRS